MRASAKYRLDVARALLRKALTEIGGTSTQQTRIIGHPGGGEMSMQLDRRAEELRLRVVRRSTAP